MENGNEEGGKVSSIFMKPITNPKDENTWGTLHANKPIFDREERAGRNFRPGAQP